ncbi:unnamed protein product, partial [Prorocentrum cordatum]
ARPELAALSLAENVSSMSEADRCQFTDAHASLPIEPCASGCSPEPPVTPAGLAGTGPAARARFESEQYRCAPRQYKLGNMVFDGQLRFRPLTSAELCGWAFQPSREVEGVRCGLHGNAFSPPVVAMLLGRGLSAAGALARPPTVAECWGARDVEADEYVSHLLGQAPSSASCKEAREAMREGPVRSAIFRGSDARIASGRLIHFCDSQARIAVACKGRSTSSPLRRLLRGSSTLLLSTPCQLFYVFARSEPDLAPKWFFNWLASRNEPMPEAAAAADEVLGEFVEGCWAQGAPESIFGDVLSGLQQFVPCLRRALKDSWRLFSTWSKNEAPSRARPLLPEQALAMAGFALSEGDAAMAAAVLVRFSGFLRPVGAMLQASRRAWDLGRGLAHVDLGVTKGGKRAGAAEHVVIDEPEAVIILARVLGNAPG